MHPGDKREAYFNDMFFDHINFKGKVVVDYGCGGGQMGVYLHTYKEIKKYIGIDIAERSIEFSKRNLEEFEHELYVVPVDFGKLDADIFMTIACIQHFPSEKFLELFLKNINRSGIRIIILQFRQNDVMRFNDAYDIEGEGDKGTACLTNETYISSRLTNYNLFRKSEIIKISQVLIYKLK